MIAASFSALVNHLLSQVEWGRQSLREHAGKTAAFELFPGRIAVTIDAEGTLAPASSAAMPAVVIRITHAALLKVLAGEEDAWRKAEVEGDTELAAVIARLAANLRWDVEEDLSKVFGDIAARRMAGTARVAAAWPRQAAIELATNVAEYLTEETHTLVTPLQAEGFVSDVDQLRDAVERLDKRIERLQRELRRG
jgi:ubiquinone biosynthesis protein UbiJ